MVDKHSVIGAITQSFLNTSETYIMEIATQTVADEKREPITKQEPTQQLLVTGQWLYDTFVAADDTTVTRMQQIKTLVEKGCDPFQLKGAADNMVKQARELDLASGVPAKVLDEETGKERVNRGPKQQAAMNVRTIIQNAYGALKFARKELDTLGYDDSKTGYLAMAVLAKRALDAKGLKWNGVSAPTEEEQMRKRIARAQKQETGAMAKAFADNPRMPGEDDLAWTARVTRIAHDIVEDVRTKQEEAAISEIVTMLFEKYDAQRLQAVACRIFDRLSEQHGGAAFSYTTEAEPEEVQEVEHV